MRQGKSSKAAATVLYIGCASACLFGLSAAAQNVTVDLGQRLSIKNGEGVARTQLGARLNSETRTQAFDLSVGGGLETRFNGGQGIEFVDPFARAKYQRNNRDGAFKADYGFSRRDISSFTDQNGVNVNGILTGGGSRDTTDGGFSLTFGENAPFGGSADLRFSQTRFSNTTDPDLVPIDTLRGNVALRFKLDPRIRLTTTLGFSEVDRDGGVDVRRNTLGAGLEFDVTKVLTAGVNLGATRIDEDGVVTNGAFGGVSFTLALPNGSLSGGLDSEFTENGRRTTLQVTRARSFKDADLVFGVGLSRGEAGKLRPLVNLSYDKKLKDGVIGFTASQSFSSSSGGAETLTSSLRSRYQVDINSRTKFFGSIGYSESSVVNGAGDDRERLDLSLRLTWDLTKRFDVETGYEFARTRRGTVEETNDELFVGVRTSFDWRP